MMKEGFFIARVTSRGGNHYEPRRDLIIDRTMLIPGSFNSIKAAEFSGHFATL